ncbi:MAG: DUF4129 domain-containing protein [Gemmatimonadota bacterium]|jgi:hypothetical protein
MQQAGIPDAETVREAFQEVLAGPDFQYAGTSPLVRAYRAVIEWLQDLFRNWFPGLGESETRILSWVVLGLCALFVVHLLVRRFRGRSVPPRKDRSAAGPRSKPRDAAGWLAWARRSAQEGRLRDAATGVYQATILNLDARGALRYGEWKTPGDYAMEVSAPDVRAPFLSFLDRFLEIAFGPTEPTAEAYEALSAGAARLGGAA